MEKLYVFKLKEQSTIECINVWESFLFLSLDLMQAPFYQCLLLVYPTYVYIYRNEWYEHRVDWIIFLIIYNII